ncbi:daunorubicin resistance protein DrrA family ABC transporter ATP-binding protein [Pseudolysinimonas kribbensis]|uniref:Daunorubicin resistance protein DrrA family ABC transporter ATP-binding protein n=1 Tax=Pseudolysinimonas kribbensis TaxID=433641 RepID=A0ABQ6K9N1_9MICO|nr:ATP-binding cassette domain-containing protein [Pseudolysinimonas kribbensis]GMA96305.1 daunorubicin resistance protein DrrA family ABC transporter ATP-binding protein [Pseudolysinimonas kribbensis]
MTSTAPAVALRGVRKAFGKTVVLDGLDLAVDRGTIVALLGPNGAGKTTTVNILSTLVAPDAGTATVNGFDVARQPEQVKASISVTGQSAAVDEVLSGEENLRMMGRLSGLTAHQARRRAAELLDRFDLRAAGRKRVKTWSGGMRRKLDIAISLLRTPPVIFLDEPTTGLDTRSRQDLWAMIRRLADDGTTVVLTTQYLEEADVLADRVAVIDHGRVVAEGTPAELKARVGGEVLALHDADGAVVREVPTDGTLTGLRRALALVGDDALDGVSLRAPSLDDVFLAVTGSPAAASTHDQSTENQKEIA